MHPQPDHPLANDAPHETPLPPLEIEPSGSTVNLQPLLSTPAAAALRQGKTKHL
jgi:hypothetical protein